MTLQNIISNHFSLSQESLNDVINYINNPINISDYNIIEEQPNRRLILDINEDIFIPYCEDYKLFSQLFKEEIEKYNITYNNYKTNKIKIEKNDFKLFKFLEKINKINILNKYNNNINISISNSKLEQLITSDMMLEINEFKNKLNQIIKIKSTKNNNLKFVISRNYNDFFLSATNQKFTSCLDLNSINFENANWIGLPSLFTDNNRAICYITDNTKVNYYDIESLKMYSRSWLLLTDTNEINIANIYPSSTLENYYQVIIETIFNKKTFIGNKQNTKSKYPIKPIWLENNILCNIYQDSSKLEFINNDLYHNFSEKGFSKINKNNEEYDLEEIQFNGSLNYLISKNKSILEYKDIVICKECNSEENVLKRELSDTYLCENCYKKDFDYCSVCGNEILLIDAKVIQIDDEYYCEKCSKKYLS
jgi:hypothetical protein